MNELKEYGDGSINQRKNPWCSRHGFYCAVGGKECPWHNPEIGVGVWVKSGRPGPFYRCTVCGDTCEGFGFGEGERHRFCMGTARKQYN